ncbi:septum formation inhibitor Maf [Aliivibrio fischeri]|uniref:7-methyl-GTP pyrophosphatase n=1 Tax=Aliivibrio fischeri TaxID=668 RepID=A0A510UDW7_ALIFS|nr:Maf family protein [Aliivibrio fischeri]MUK29921.1 septum formation inhibitor Maf [Aliivibrio fischeri]MUK65764.1 septum formation inhibitor Maf [Aliivibrio fischeri]GEK12756.1 Maf-like protein [Aliivibrio fischeri]
MQSKLILASTSPFRKEILSKIQLDFDAISPICDETPLKNESPINLVTRLAETKASSCDIEDPNYLIIGSDQVCVINGKIIGKPLTREKAVQQLEEASGQKITFYTGLSVFNTTTKQAETICEEFNVYFKKLSRQQIENYVDKEEPFYCAGSFKCEGLGIALFEKLEGKDPNTLIGLPLISLIDMLEKQGLNVL